MHIIYTYSAYVTHGNGTCTRGNGGGGDGGCNGKNSMFYIISRRIHCIFFVFIYVLNRIREPYEYTHPLHMFALYPFFSRSSQNDGKKHFIHSSCANVPMNEWNATFYIDCVHNADIQTWTWTHIRTRNMCFTKYDYNFYFGYTLCVVC